MALERQAGVAYLKVDGQQLALKGELEISPLEFTREPITGVDGVHGYKETPKAPSIAGKVTVSKDFDLTKLAGWTGKTVTGELGNGAVYVLSDAFQSGELNLNGVEGETTITFFGHKCRKI